MKIAHRPLFDTDKVCELYSEKDGVPIKYVCTTDLRNSDVPWDVFYRADGSSHPQFGNQYFGLTKHEGRLLITNADLVEDFDFGMFNHNDEWHYSQSHHDCVMLGESMIDGGRQYVRGSLDVVTFFVCEGEFKKADK